MFEAWAISMSEGTGRTSFSLIGVNLTAALGVTGLLPFGETFPIVFFALAAVLGLALGLLFKTFFTFAFVAISSPLWMKIIVSVLHEESTRFWGCRAAYAALHPQNRPSPVFRDLVSINMGRAHAVLSKNFTKNAMDFRHIFVTSFCRNQSAQILPFQRPR